MPFFRFKDLGNISRCRHLKFSRFCCENLSFEDFANHFVTIPSSDLQLSITSQTTSPLLIDDLKKLDERQLKNVAELIHDLAASSKKQAQKNCPLRAALFIIYSHHSCNIPRYTSSLAFTYPARRFSIADRSCFTWYASKAL